MKTGKLIRKSIIAATVAAVVPIMMVANGQDDYYEGSDRWIGPGQGGILAARTIFDNAFGRLGVINESGEVDMSGHPFFEPLGSNGRACVTCHQPSDGMALSLDSIRERWELSGGSDPLFSPIDGANCPNMPRGEYDSHSLLLERGLIRVGIPWPPQPRNNVPVVPEFTIEVVRDPTGCNLHEEYGLYSDNPTISLYRRPRVAANLKYIVFEGGPFNAKRLAMVNDRDPYSGQYMSMNMMADAREPSLKTQAMSAAMGHLELPNGLTDEQLEKVVEFESQLYMAQEFSHQAGQLEYEGGPEALGPMAMVRNERGLGDNFGVPLFRWFDMWNPAPGETAEQRTFRESVARGHDVFFIRPFMISDTAHINTVGMGNPQKRTCATCHNAAMTGTDVSAGWVDVGSTNLPFAKEAVPNPWTDDKHQLPLFKITCNQDARPHPFLGREIYTQDPGRALISGKCYDVGSIVMGQLRGLAARAPFFSNGSAESIRDLVDFYDRRFNIGYTEQERQDLVNFLSVL